VPHLPFRSLTQFRKKAKLVYRCIERNPPEYLGVRVGLHWVRIINALYRHKIIKEEFERQFLSEPEIETYLQEGVLQRDDALSRRLGELSRPLPQ